MRVSSSDTFLFIHRVSKRSLYLILSSSGDMDFSTTGIWTFRVPMVFFLPLYPLSFGLETIDRVVVDLVGGKGWILDFGVASFAGGFERVGVCFATTFAVFGPLVFPNVFAAS